MNFDFSDDQKEIQTEVRRFLADRASPAKVRAILDGDAPYQKELWLELGAMGFAGAAIEEKYGGSGLGYLELCVIAEEIGRSAAAVPFSSTVYLAAELLKNHGSDDQKAAWLPQIASAARIFCLATSEGPGQGPIKARVTANRLWGIKGPVVDGDIADLAIVLAQDDEAGGDLSLFLVNLADVEASRRTLGSLDPTRGLAQLSFDGVSTDRIGAAGCGEMILKSAYDAAAALIAFEQIGGADRCIEMARDYSLDRFAFGQPIGSFQAMKHLMADMYAMATLARSNAYHGAWALSTGSAQFPLAASYARVSAIRAFQFCSANNLHIHGGMGFTWEFDCHLYYRRSQFLALQCGTLTEWSNILVERLIEAGGPGMSHAREPSIENESAQSYENV